MPALIPRHEAFAIQYVALDCHGTQAAIAAGYSKRTAANQASRLLTRDDILNRIFAIQEKTRVKHDVTIDSLVAELEEARVVATDNRQAGAMAAATLGKAKLLGLIVDKSKITAEHTNLDTMSDQQIETYIAGLQSALPDTILQ